MPRTATAREPATRRAGTRHTPARPGRSLRDRVLPARPGARRTSRRRLARVLAVPALIGLVVAAQAPASIVVHKGDNFWAIAQAHHTTVSALKQLNHLTSDTIYAGQALRVPGQNTPAPKPAKPSATAPAPAGSLAATVAATRAAIAKRPQPSAAQARAMVEQAARTAGLDRRLALAIATQESGFNARAVSGSNAVGVMQVLPSTVSWIATSVLHRPLDPLKAADNIAAGVAYLKILVVSASSTDQAIAGYYQGLAGVRAHGMYTDTKQYVANVKALRSRIH
jgi:soluble lytic murein transglycosylase-like protein